MKTKFIPMLFSTPMVEAIDIYKTKTETRRLVKFPKDFDGNEVYDNGNFGLKYSTANSDGGIFRLFPKVNVGDVIWVRETWQHTKSAINLSLDDENSGYIYKASQNGKDWEKNTEEWKWKPSLFMPKEACRIFLKVVSVHAERLQDIDEQSAIAEGIEDMLLNVDVSSNAYRNYMVTKKDFEADHWSHVANDAIESYQTLWQKINGKKSWDENPWVWVYKFERIEKPIEFNQ